MIAILVISTAVFGLTLGIYNLLKWRLNNFVLPLWKSIAFVVILIILVWAWINLVILDCEIITDEIKKL